MKIISPFSVKLVGDENEISKDIWKKYFINRNKFRLLIY